VDEVGDGDADHIEGEHGGGEEAHAEGVGGGADDGGDDEDGEDGVADVGDEEFGVDDAEEGEKEDKDGQFEGDAEAEDDGEEEAGVVLGGDDGVEVFAEVEDEDLHGSGEDPVVAEPRSCEEEDDGGGHEGDDVALLVGVHAGRDEEPELIEDEGAGEDGSEDEGGFEVEVEGVGGVEDAEAAEAERGVGRHDVAVEFDVEGVGDGEADEEITDGVDEALAELGEMLHEAHAGELGAIRDGGSDAVDGVEISHGGRPRWGRSRGWRGLRWRGRVGGGWR
jgi:hypothetical protein